LNGCVNDVTNVRDILLKFFAFRVDDIRLLVDERATKQAIMDRLTWLVKGAKAGDRLLFHYSGHGSQIRDRDGDELKDKMDEILCPHNMDWDGTYIVDDELQKIFSCIISGVLLEIFLDCCHSGTGTRVLRGLEKLPPEFSFKPRFLPPPIDLQSRIDEDLEVKRLFRTINPVSHILFAGCRDNQTSADAMIGGHYNGAFTYYLCKHLRDTSATINRAELLKRVRASLRFNDFNQVPQLEAPKDKVTKKLLDV